MQTISGFLIEIWKFINEVYKTNIYCLIRGPGLKLWALGDISSTIDVTSGP